MKTFYEKFKELCVRNGVSQSKVMADVGFTRSAATFWSQGRGPKESSIKIIAEYFDVDPMYLKGDSIETNQQQKHNQSHRRHSAH